MLLMCVIVALLGYVVVELRMCVFVDLRICVYAWSCGDVRICVCV